MNNMAAFYVESSIRLAQFALANDELPFGCDETRKQIYRAEFTPMKCRKEHPNEGFSRPFF
ncbi:MAG: hypothetical protein LH481_00835, partial [Burkholderiales bacterium]|nr:hypothetical protein [Burkholderiales bacterium]